MQNKDTLIDQLKKQIEELNDVLYQTEEDLKLFEESKQKEFKEYNEQMEILIQEKNVLHVQNIELTENLSLANENLKKLNDIISEKYANVEEELFKQTNKNENMIKKYKDILKHMKNKQNILNEENIKLKEIINKQDLSMDNDEDNDNKMNQIQNLNLYNKVTGDNYKNNNLNFENNITTNMNNNIINNNEQTFGNNNMDKSNDIDYYLKTSYVDTKEQGQKRTLNDFKILLNKMDERIDIP